jgi:uncharacterized damage-inducible protein DinB
VVEKIPAGLSGLIIAAATIAQPAQISAQGTEPEGLRADLHADVVQLEEKYLGLAEAMPASSWDWTPMEGVRSVGEVFCHVAGANFMIPRFFGVDAPADAVDVEQLCAATEPAARKSGTIQALRASFEFARDAIEAVDDASLDDPTKLFGRDTTKRSAMLLFVTHMHEHLGQSVAYARSNGVVPPWSAGG